MDEIEGYKKEFDELLQLCKKNNIKTTKDLEYDESLKYPTKIIYNDITKYIENKKILPMMNGIYEKAFLEVVHVIQILYCIEIFLNNIQMR